MADNNAAPTEEEASTDTQVEDVDQPDQADAAEADAAAAEADDVDAVDEEEDGPTPPEELTELPVAEAEPKINDIVYGKVARLVDFGAFVDISAGPSGDTLTGLVHVSEVDAGFVENIYAHLAEGQIVNVKVLSMGDDGKIGLSIKQADPEWEDLQELDRPRRSTIDKDFDRRLRKFMHNSQSIQGEARRQRRSRLGRER